MSKIGRNDPCSCGSGKKFKKCCEERMTRKKFSAQVMTPGSASRMTSFFQRKVEIVKTKVPEGSEPSTPPFAATIGSVTLPTA